MTDLKRRRLLILSLLSGILLSLSWYPWFSGIILLIAMVPLLLVEEYLYSNKDHYRPYVCFGFTYLSFFIWNLLTTWWIYKATFGGAAIVVVVNSFLLTLVFFLFHITKRNLGRRFGNFSLLVYWIGWEHLYLNAEISWPWLNLGNGFAKDITFIQWYEYTGTLGGTLWVLAVNFVIFGVLRHFILYRSFATQFSRLIFLLVLIILPVVISINIMENHRSSDDQYQVGLIQPNIDPYQEKFSGMSQEEQLDVIINLSENIVTPETDYILGPETALYDYIRLDELESNPSVQRIGNFVNRHPQVSYIIGMDSFKKYRSEEKPTPAARRIGESDSFIEKFNSAVQIDTSETYQVHHKSKLIVGVEKMPYPGIFGFLNELILDLGGTTGTRGTQENRGTFHASAHSVNVAPVICYESIYGAYVSEYIDNGASFIFIMTNDGWWGETIGYRQHLHYARLRAIETRRSIARSANTGISCLINQKGRIIKSTDWWEKTAIRGTISANDEKTFYVRYGDYIGRIAGFMAVLAVLYLIAKVLIDRSRHADLEKLRKPGS
ncbi:MAG: apolipoprotein N-acyltransferase [Bacteroidota bacterium]